MLGANKKKKVSEFATPYTVGNALTKGGATVKLSALVMGLANMAHKQIIKGLIFLAIEIAYIAYMVSAGAYYISMLPSLGWRKQEEVFNEQKQIYEYVAGDQSVLLLLYGVITIAITVLFIYMWCENLKSGYKAECLSKAGKEINSFGKDVKDLFDKNLHKTLMFLPLMGIFVFTVLPLLFMIPMAFTNYSVKGDHLVLFDWTGFASFGQVLGLGGKLGKIFWRVLGWTICWAVFATFLCNFLGLILAIVINRKETHCKAFWRTCFVISIAVPQFVSLLVMRQMFQPQGAVNNLLLEWGWIDNPLPFWTNTMWARVSVILINCWVGIPYTMLQVTGVLQNVPSELYEAAKIDGADILVNGTLLGMKPKEDTTVISDTTMFHEGLVVADVVYNPEETRFLREAKEHGCITVPGKGMLLWQGVASFKLFTGKDMPVDEVKERFFQGV